MSNCCSYKQINLPKMTNNIKNKTSYFLCDMLVVTRSTHSLAMWPFLDRFYCTILVECTRMNKFKEEESEYCMFFLLLISWLTAWAIKRHCNWMGEFNASSLSVNKYEPEYLWSYRRVNIQRVSIYSASPFGLERDNMLHPPPAQPELSDTFTVKVMILDTRNERAPAWPVDSGISLMNWTTKPCWYKEEVFRIGWQSEFFKH